MFECFKTKHIHKPKEQSTLTVQSAATFSQMKIEVHGLDNFTIAEKEKFMKAMLIGELVLNSWDFRMEVMSSSFTESKGMNGKQIWELICTGQDLFNTKEDHDIDVFVTMYDNFWTGTVGYTFKDTFKTWFNNKFFRNFDEAEILGNVIHEAMHNIGFEHRDLVNKLTSVPYKVGYIAREIARKQMKGEMLSPLLRKT